MVELSDSVDTPVSATPPTTSITKIYVTFTTKPLNVAVRERLPAAQASVVLDDLAEVHLGDMLVAARKVLEDPHGAD
jgi:hypothetical protein